MELAAERFGTPPAEVTLRHPDRHGHELPTRHRDEPEINLIPFIDVLLVVLIFLMLTTTYSKFTELQVNLPVADADAGSANRPQRGGRGGRQRRPLQRSTR